MALTLKEKMAKAKHDKDMKRATRQAKRTDMSGVELAAKLTERPIDLEWVDIGMRGLDLRKENPAVEEALKKDAEAGPFLAKLDEEAGSWIQDTRDLLKHIPLSRRIKLHSLSWREWLSYGEDLGMDESKVVAILRVVYMLGVASKKTSMTPSQKDSILKRMNTAPEMSLMSA